MAFNKNKVMQWARSNSKMGSTALSSLSSTLYKLPNDADSSAVFAAVEKKMRAAGEYPDQRKVLDEWRRSNIAA